MSNSVLATKTIRANFIVPLSHHSRSYKLVQLSNGILALLISDPTKAVVSTAVCVAAGSHNDPPDVLGLAHFCEHMVFMGTKQFPEPDLLQRLVYSHGGQVNAHTTGEQTSFYFELPSITARHDSSNFQELLLVFASMFKNPLFSSSHCEEELQAVNAEHMSNTNSQGKQFYHALRLLANEDHPFSNFGTGNMQTILKTPKSKNINVLKELKTYFNKYYVPERMTLVIRGPQSLNQLCKSVLVSFGDLPSSFSPESTNGPSWSPQDSPRHSALSLDKFRRRRSKVRHSGTSTSSQNSNSSETTLPFHATSRNSGQHIPVFTHRDLNRCLLIKTANKDSTLRLIFPTAAVATHPSLEVFKRTWISLLGNESRGSLCQELISQKNLATGVVVFSQDLTQRDSVILLEVKLTKQGQQNVQLLLMTVFEYIYKVVFEASLEELSRLLADLAKIDKINYLFQDCSDSAVDEVSCLAERLQSCPHKTALDNLIRGYATWDESGLHLSDSVKDFIDASKQVLSLNNFNMIMLTNETSSLDGLLFSSAISNWLTDPYFHFEYKIYHIESFSMIEKIFKKTPSSMSLPASNEFLAHFDYTELDRRLCRTTDAISSNPLGLAAQRDNMDEQPAPSLIDYTKYYELWHQKVHINKASESEKVSASFKTQPLNLSPSTKTSIGIEILCNVIGDSLRYKLYPAEEIGYSWGIFPSVNSTSSIMFSLNGLAQSFLEVMKCAVDDMIQVLTSIHTLTYQVFKDTRLEMRRHYEGLIDGNSVHKVLAASYVFLEEDVATLEERIEAIEEVDLEDLIFMSKSFLKHLKYTSILINGTLELSAISKLSKIINSLTRHEKVEIERKNFVISEPSSYLLPVGADYISETTTADRVNMIFYYIQLGVRDSAYERTMGALVSYLLSTRASNELRTKRQLGYTVLSGMRLFRKTLGAHITISSDKYEPHYLKLQIEEFLSFMKSEISKMTEEEFQTSIVEPFLTTYEQINSESSGPCTSILSLDPVKGSNAPLSGELHLTHSYSWEKIVNRTYRFSNGQREEDVDKRIVKTLDKMTFQAYFGERIDPYSPYKSAFSFMLKSQSDEERLNLACIGNQVKRHTKSNGTSLESENTRAEIPSYINMEGELYKKDSEDEYSKQRTLGAANSIVHTILKLKSGISKGGTPKTSIRSLTEAKATRNRGTIVKCPRDLHKECQVVQETKLEHIYNFLKKIDTDSQDNIDYLDMLEI